MKFTFDHNGVDQDKPLIYLWVLTHPDGTTDLYVGKAKSGSSRPLKHYKRNVTRLISGKPYRKSKPDQWRAVHLAMGKCVELGGSLHLKLLTNTTLDEINAVERGFIKYYAANLNS